MLIVSRQKAHTLFVWFIGQLGRKQQKLKSSSLPHRIHEQIQIRTQKNPRQKKGDGSWGQRGPSLCWYESHNRLSTRVMPPVTSGALSHRMTLSQRRTSSTRKSKRPRHIDAHDHAAYDYVDTPHENRSRQGNRTASRTRGRACSQSSVSQAWGAISAGFLPVGEGAVVLPYIPCEKRHPCVGPAGVVCPHW